MMWCCGNCRDQTTTIKGGKIMCGFSLGCEYFDYGSRLIEFLNCFWSENLNNYFSMKRMNWIWSEKGEEGVGLDDKLSHLFRDEMDQNY